MDTLDKIFGHRDTEKLPRISGITRKQGGGSAGPLHHPP